MKTIFEVRDRVFDILHGWGEVTYLYNYDWEKLASERLVCIVEFDGGGEYHYTKNVALKLLSFTEYGFDERFSQERPIDYNEYVGKWGKFWDNGENTVIVGKLYGYYQYQIHHFKARTHDDEVAFYTNFEPLTDEQLKVLGVKNEY